MSSAQLCFGKVHHTRLSPVRNSFNYGVYFLRLPLRELEAHPVQSKLFSRNRFNLLSHHEKDHGDGKQPLLQWIGSLLNAQGIHDADGEVWLQTFPRVLGYVFNPVSFWFCHRSDGELRAILCEVSNTFGERHNYIVAHADARPIAAGDWLTARKVFHVSPFFPVSGSYRFRFADSGGRCDFRIDYDDGQGHRLVTRISGAAQTLDSAALARAFAAYPWMTLGVMLRIHYHALRLWLKRLPFFPKPIPPAEDTTR